MSGDGAPAAAGPDAGPADPGSRAAPPGDGDAGLDLGLPRRIHIVGIGGAGMSAIATVLTGMGHRVSGTDLRPSAVLDRLAGAGISVEVGHHPERVATVDIVATSTAVPATDPEVVAAHHRSVPVLTRAQILAAIGATRSVLAVAGTHGKTTTSAMLTSIVVAAGIHASWIVGGDIVGLGGGAGWDPAGTTMVIEADESDGTFLTIPRQAGIVTSVEPDHLDFYGDEAAMVAAYGTFLSACGQARVVCADDAGAARLGQATAAAGDPVITYGTAAAADWTLDAIVEDRLGIGFDIHGPSGEQGHVDLAVPGLHNARNAAGALALAVAVGVPFSAALDGLARFQGVARRLERRGERAGVTFVDDYAHLPGEVATTVTTVAGAGWGRVIVVFQPHRYTRTRALHAAFADAFVGADVLVITGIYPSGETPEPGISGHLVADAVTAAHPEQELIYCEDLGDLPGVLAGILAPGDLCLTLGAGDLTTVPGALVAAGW